MEDEEQHFEEEEEPHGYHDTKPVPVLPHFPHREEAQDVYTDTKPASPNGYDDTAPKGAPLATGEEDEEANDFHYDQVNHGNVKEHPLAPPAHPMAGSGLTAVAIYDYQAGNLIF